MQNKPVPVSNTPSLYAMNHFANVPVGMASPLGAVKDTAGSRVMARASGAGQQPVEAATGIGRSATTTQDAQLVIRVHWETAALVGVVVCDVHYRMSWSLASQKTPDTPEAGGMMAS